jgi:hypothetical protein
MIMRCDTCKKGRTVHNLRVRCSETGNLLSAFTEACELYDRDEKKLNRGWGVLQKLMRRD